jgi:hypothetical protein
MSYPRPVRYAAWLVAAALLAASARASAGPPPFEPSDRYETRAIRGWSVRVHKGFLSEKPELADRVLALLDVQLYLIERNVPARAVAKLRKVVLWVEENEPHHPCMAYHPDTGWLREHGMNPEKARCVEIANARNFLSWTHEQPWMVLHELSHAYHHQFLDGGFQNPKVAAAYRRAKEAGRYDSVLHYDGKEVKGYAATNPMEYFAEATEAYFGSNDFFPFVRAELRRHDPEAFELLRSLWDER